MRNLPVVSIILPTFNRAHLLPRAVKSVLAQSYPHWELIIWDDGSSDNTIEIVSSFNEKRIHYYYDVNRGVAYARNRAIEKSSGNLLAFLDSDDEWRADKLAEQIKVMCAHPEIEILFTDFDSINEESGHTVRTFKQYDRAMKSLLVEKSEQNLFIIHEGILHSLATENFIATDTIMLQRKVFISKGCFNESLHNSEDFELWWRLGLSNIRFAYLNKVYMTRHKPAGSLSSGSDISFTNHIKALDICTSEAIAAGRPDLAVSLKPQYRNTWQNYIVLFGKSNNTKGVIVAFFRSLKYGFSLGSVKLLIQGLLHQLRQEEKK